MSAFGFQAEFVKQFRCKLDLAKGSEFSWDASRESSGAACLTCEGCESRSGSLGLAADGVEIEMSHGQMALVWKCPGCGCAVTEKTTPLGSLVHAREAKEDGLCFKCRRRVHGGDLLRAASGGADGEITE